MTCFLHPAIPKFLAEYLASPAGIIRSISQPSRLAGYHARIIMNYKKCKASCKNSQETAGLGH